MTYQERIEQVLHGGDSETERLIRYAYYLGKTRAARAVCDEHSKRLAAMRVAASKARYHHLAHTIIDAGQAVRGDGWEVAGNPDAIYHPDYDGDYADTFGGDDTTL